MWGGHVMIEIASADRCMRSTPWASAEVNPAMHKMNQVRNAIDGNHVEKCFQAWLMLTTSSFGNRCRSQRKRRGLTQHPAFVKICLIYKLIEECW